MQANIPISRSIQVILTPPNSCWVWNNVYPQSHVRWDIPFLVCRRANSYERSRELGTHLPRSMNSYGISYEQQKSSQKYGALFHISTLSHTSPASVKKKKSIIKQILCPTIPPLIQYVWVMLCIAQVQRLNSTFPSHHTSVKIHVQRSSCSSSNDNTKHYTQTNWLPPTQIHRCCPKLWREIGMETIALRQLK